MSFQYKALDSLDEIRLIILEPGQPEEGIVCHLKHVSLDSDISYEAISYVWGDPTLTQEILVEDQSFAITINLHAALQQLRYLDRKRVLWADAACINQSSNEEKTLQVQRMGDIYEHAQRVLIWLGVETEETATAFDCIERCLSFFPSPEVWFSEAFDRKTWKIEQGDLVSAGKTSIFDIDVWRSIARLLRRPWFTRKWIIQEVSRSRTATILNGQKLIDWTEFSLLFKLFSSDGEISGMIEPFIGTVGGPRATQAMSHIDIITNNLQNMNIQEVVWNTSSFDCTDPMDHIMAMLPINTILEKSREEIDLNYGLGPAEMYTRITRWSIIANSSLGILQLCSNPSDRQTALETIPSWVPDFGRVPYSRPIGIDGPHFCASGNRPLSARVLADDRTLSVRGRTICALTILVKPLLTRRALAKMMEDNDPNCLSWPESLRVLNERALAQKEWLSQCRLVALGCLGMEPVQHESFWRTLMCDIDPVTQERYGESMGIKFKGYWNVLGLPGGDPADIPESDWPLAEAERNVLQYASRRFFASTTGQLGNAPEGAESGDLVCVINGGIVPYLLRLRNDGYYTLIGECYLHGSMHGEALELEGIEEKEYQII